MLHGRTRPFARTAAGSTSGAAEAATWQAAVIANGGTVSAGRLVVVTNFITAEKAAGTWALTDDYWPLWGENAAQSLTSLKQRRLATAVAAPTFTADRGYAFNGTTNYIDTGFVPSTMAVAMTANTLRAAVYERTNAQLTNAFAFGGMSSGIAIGIVLNPMRGAASTGEARCNTGVTLNAATITDSRGLFAISAVSGANLQGYKNGAVLTVDATTASSGITTASMYIGAFNNAGAFASGRATSVGFACMGAQLTPAQEAAQYANVQAWATAVGANV